MEFGLGVPYGFIDPESGEQVCPVKECQKRFAEEFDVNGEQLTDNYAQHYLREHGGGQNA